MSSAACRAFVLRFLVLAAVWTAALALFNAAVDPDHRYRLRVPGAQLETLAAGGEPLAMPANYDDRTLLARYIRACRRPDTVVFGGSRVLNVTGAAFGGGRLLNAGLTAGTSRDDVAVWQLLKNEGKAPKTAFLCVDAQGLNRESRNALWLPLAAAYESFYGRSRTLRHALAGLLQNFRELTSWQTTQRAWTMLVRRRAGEDTRLVRRTPEFSLLYPPGAEDKDPEAVRTLARRNGEGEARALRHWSRDDREGAAEAQALLKDLKAAGVRPVLVLMPYHPEALRVISGDPEAARRLSDLREELRSIAEGLGVPFYDGCLDSERTLRNDDFLDGVHLKRASNEAFFRHLVGIIDIR